MRAWLARLAEATAPPVPRADPEASRAIPGQWSDTRLASLRRARHSAHTQSAQRGYRHAHSGHVPREWLPAGGSVLAAAFSCLLALLSSLRPQCIIGALAKETQDHLKAKR